MLIEAWVGPLIEIGAPGSMRERLWKNAKRGFSQLASSQVIAMVGSTVLLMLHLEHWRKAPGKVAGKCDHQPNVWAGKT
jgi:hypothetical protein